MSTEEIKLLHLEEMYEINLNRCFSVRLGLDADNQTQKIKLSTKSLKVRS